jgi:hypothetical protein
MANWPLQSFDTLHGGSVVTLASTQLDAQVQTSVERLSNARYFLTSVATVGAGNAVSVGRAAALATTLDRDRILQETPSGVVSDSVIASDSLALGGVRWSELSSIADQVVSGTVQLTDSSNYFPLVFANGDLTVSGTGRGILAVAGRVQLAVNTTFTGLIVARDGVTINTGAQITGAIISRSGPVSLAAPVNYSPADIQEAALKTPSSRRIVLRSRLFIPAF